ncbi:hypothetical protein E2562_021892 [Oryza meyeriana var. granulata]|uniref:Uncharacterized protein n=1 Tax=Oryza meyeriana var. granulata TaxID=110450 RepID=A0A6G1C7D1_9ORYZ|nr:hypothetical protein E2562_021892 [Oryza meyeriana var. granulata]
MYTSPSGVFASVVFRGDGTSATGSHTDFCQGDLEGEDDDVDNIVIGSSQLGDAPLEHTQEPQSSTPALALRDGRGIPAPQHIYSQGHMSAQGRKQQKLKRARGRAKDVFLRTVD